MPDESVNGLAEFYCPQDPFMCSLIKSTEAFLNADGQTTSRASVASFFATLERVCIKNVKDPYVAHRCADCRLRAALGDASNRPTAPPGLTRGDLIAEVCSNAPTTPKNSLRTVFVSLLHRRFYLITLAKMAHSERMVPSTFVAPEALRVRVWIERRPADPSSCRTTCGTAAIGVACGIEAATGGDTRLD